MGAELSIQLMGIARLIATIPVEAQHAKGKRSPLADQATLEDIRRCWDAVPGRWKSFLRSTTGNRLYQRLATPGACSVEKLESEVQCLIWGWAENPQAFYSGDRVALSIEAPGSLAARPLDDFFLSIIKLTKQQVVNDICWRIWTVCFFRMVERILPPRSELPRQRKEVVAVLVDSGLVSETVLEKADLQEFLHAGKVYSRVMEACSGEGALIYIPRLTRPTWDKYLPVETVDAANVLSPIANAVRAQAEEIWAPRDGQPKSANQVVETLFDHFDGILSSRHSFIAWVPDEEPARQEGHADKEQRNQPNRERSGPTNGRQRVRKPATPRAERRRATRPTQPRRPIPGPRQGGSPTGGSSHTGDSAGARSREDGNRHTQDGVAQEGTVDSWNGVVGGTAAEMEPGNGYGPVQASIGQDQQHTTSNDNFHQSAQGVQGSINEGGNGLAPILGNGLQLPPLGANQSLARDLGSSNQLMVTPYRGPIPSALTSPFPAAGHSPANHSAFRVHVQSNDFSGIPPPPPDNVTRPSDSNDQPMHPGPTPYVAATSPHSFGARTPNEIGQSASSFNQWSTYRSSHHNPVAHQPVAHGYSREQRGGPPPAFQNALAPVEPPAFTASEWMAGGTLSTLYPSGGPSDLNMHRLGSQAMFTSRSPPAPTSTLANPLPVGTKSSRRRCNQDPGEPTNSRQRVRKPSTHSRADQRTTTCPTQPRRPVPAPRRGESRTRASSHARLSPSSRSQDDGNRSTQNGGVQEGAVDDWNGTVDNAATEHEASNGHEGQGTGHTNHGYNPSPTHFSAAQGSGSGIQNDDDRPHPTSNDDLHQSSQCVRDSMSKNLAVAITDIDISPGEQSVSTWSGDNNSLATYTQLFPSVPSKPITGAEGDEHWTFHAANLSAIRSIFGDRLYNAVEGSPTRMLEKATAQSPRTTECVKMNFPRQNFQDAIAWIETGISIDLVRSLFPRMDVRVSSLLPSNPINRDVQLPADQGLSTSASISNIDTEDHGYFTLQKASLAGIFSTFSPCICDAIEKSQLRAWEKENGLQDTTECVAMEICQQLPQNITIRLRMGFVVSTRLADILYADNNTL